MPSFVVDPILCTTPEPEASRETLDAWITLLDTWLAAAETSPFAWRHLSRCKEKLLEIYRFPDFDTFRQIRAKLGRDVPIASLLQRVNRFFQDDAYDLYTELPTQVALPAESPRIEPPKFIERNHPAVHEPLIEGLLCLSLDKARGHDFARDASIVTLPFSDRGKSVSITSGPVEVDPPNTQESSIRGEFPALFSPKDLAEFRFTALIEGGEAGFEQLVRDVFTEAFPGDVPIAFSISKDFWRSLTRAAILEDEFASEKLLKICALVVAGRTDERSLDRRPVRKTESPDSTQKTRPSDEAKAWRITVTKHGAGYRLQYWAVPAPSGGILRIDFANVLRERENVVIPDD